MFRKLRFLIAALWLLPFVIAAASADDKSTDKPACGQHGTSVDFYDTPSEAARQAKKEQKLVFVLHVSGHFEDPKLT